MLPALRAGGAPRCAPRRRGATPRAAAALRRIGLAGSLHFGPTASSLWANGLLASGQRSARFGPTVSSRLRGARDDALVEVCVCCGRVGTKCADAARERTRSVHGIAQSVTVLQAASAVPSLVRPTDNLYLPGGPCSVTWSWRGGISVRAVYRVRLDNLNYFGYFEARRRQVTLEHGDRNRAANGEAAQAEPRRPGCGGAVECGECGPALCAERWVASHTQIAVRYSPPTLAHALTVSEGTAR